MLAQSRRVWISRAFALFCACAFSGVAYAQNDDLLQASAAYYLDSRGFSTASIGLSSNRLPANLTLWGFTDIHGDHGSNSLELTRSFSEYRISHAGIGDFVGIDGLGIQAEHNAITGSGNDVTRLGFTYKHEISLPWLSGSSDAAWLQWRAFLYETDNNGGQVSLIFALPLSDRVVLKGFADYNLIDNAENRWVIEPELNFQVSERLSLLVEFRYNQFESANPQLDGSAVAAGVRYRLNR